MKTTAVATLSGADITDVVVFAFSDREPDVSGFDPSVAEALASGFARRKASEITPVFTGGRRVTVAGLGETAKFTPMVLRRAAGAAVRALQARGVSTCALVAPEAETLDAERIVYLMVLGATLGAYDAGLHKTGDRGVVMESVIVVSAAPGAEEAARRAAIIGDSANAARDLVNAPANVLPPADLARRASELGRRAGLDVETFGPDEIRRLKMAGILAVSQGSAQPPSFTVMKHLPNPNQPPVVLVGKGISFDTGGISLKTGHDMHHMKGDMGGAAAVVGALVAAGQLNLPVNVVGLVPGAENMPGGGAYRPSDVLTFANGKTVEVVNTDAEGRLVLADALIYGEREFQPRAMIDLATLTGACVIALGGAVAGLFTDDDALAAALEAAARDSSEPVWRLPLYHEYRTLFDSGVADMKNAGERGAGSITAALFLAEFVDKVPWAHLDVAGPAFDDTDKADLARGGTGYGVPLLAEFLGARAREDDKI